MLKQIIKYKEGQAFALPLRSDGWAIGVIARVGRRGVLFGYFFDIHYKHLPSMKETERLTPSNAVLEARFGDLGIKRGEWIILGDMTDWNRESWPLPKFFSFGSGVAGDVLVITYNERDLVTVDRSQRASVGDTVLYLPDSMMGYGAIEIRLTEMITSNTKA